MDYAAARQAMVDSQVRPNDVTDLAILKAISETPREVFLPAEHRVAAYAELEAPITDGRHLLTARDFAKLLQTAAPKTADLVLDVGCATGYSTAILASLCEMVVGLEIDEALAARAEQNLQALDRANAAILTGDLTKGASSQGPFDLIFVGGAVAKEPTNLLAQLADEGRLAAIELFEGVANGVVYRRKGEHVSRVRAFTSSTRNVLPGFDREPTFVF